MCCKQIISVKNMKLLGRRSNEVSSNEYLRCQKHIAKLKHDYQACIQELEKLTEDRNKLLIKIDEQNIAQRMELTKEKTLLKSVKDITCYQQRLVMNKNLQDIKDAVLHERLQISQLRRAVGRERSRQESIIKDLSSMKVTKSHQGTLSVPKFVI